MVPKFKCEKLKNDTLDYIKELEDRIVLSNQNVTYLYKKTTNLENENIKIEIELNNLRQKLEK